MIQIPRSWRYGLRAVENILDIRPFRAFPRSSVGRTIWTIMVMGSIYSGLLRSALKDPTSTWSLIMFGVTAVVIMMYVMSAVLVLRRRSKLKKLYTADHDRLRQVLNDQKFISWLRGNAANGWFNRKYKHAFVFTIANTRLTGEVPADVLLERVVTYIESTPNLYKMQTSKTNTA